MGRGRTRCDRPPRQGLESRRLAQATIALRRLVRHGVVNPQISQVEIGQVTEDLTLPVAKIFVTKPDTALGNSAKATAPDSTALGLSAQATAANSVALGVGSLAIQANTGSVGTAGGERRIVNVAAGIAATDAATVGQLNPTNTAVANETNARIAGDNMIGSQIADLSSDIRDEFRDARAGTAAALAAAGMPQAMDAGRSMFAGGLGTYRGRVALAVGASHRVSGGNTVMKPSVTYDSSDHAGANAGVGFQF